MTDPLFEPFVEPVVLFREEFKPNVELAQRIEKGVVRGFMEMGISIPIINERLYSHLVREETQTTINHYYSSIFKITNPETKEGDYKLSGMDYFQLKRRFAFLEYRSLPSGKAYEDLVSLLNANFGALTAREKTCVYGPEANTFRSKNYKLHQSSDRPGMNFSVYVRFELPKKT